MLFWIVAFLVAAIVTTLLITPLWRSQEAGVETNEDINIYRDQLREVDRDVGRGKLHTADAQKVRTEISRRILAADAQGQTRTTHAPIIARNMASGLTVLLLIAGALVLYSRIGAPGYPDVPRASRIEASEQFRAGRMSQLEAEQIAAADPLPVPDFPDDYIASIEQLRAIIPTRPDDLQGWELLSQHEYNLGNYGASARAQARVIELMGADATTDDKVILVSQLIAAARSYISPEAEEMLVTILQEDATNVAARYYYGLLFFQTDRPDRAFYLWRDIISQGDSENPYVQLSRSLIEEAAFRAGEDYTLPATRGPTRDDITATMDMTDEERQNFIADMVNRLSTRLANEGGTVEEWAQLISALATLGDTDQARTILQEARQVFVASPDALQMLDFTASTSGLQE